MGKMLVIVDYQMDFVDGALGFPGAEVLDAGIADKVDAYAAKRATIVVTLDTHGQDYLSTREGKALPVTHCTEDTEGWKLYGKTVEALVAAERAGASVLYLKKGTFGYAPEDMVQLLPQEEPESVEFVGLVSNMCVLSSVCCFQARYPGAQMVVDGGLCASFDIVKQSLSVLNGCGRSDILSDRHTPARR